MNRELMHIVLGDDCKAWPLHYQDRTLHNKRLDFFETLSIFPFFLSGADFLIFKSVPISEVYHRFCLFASIVLTKCVFNQYALHFLLKASQFGADQVSI